MIDHPGVGERIVALMNEALALDPEAIHALCLVRVPCNRALAEHETIQVICTEGDRYKVGLLGILNGLAGIGDDFSGFVRAVYENGHLVRFELRR